MRTLIITIAILALATSAFAQTTQTWNFNDWSLGGWNVTGGAGMKTTITDVVNGGELVNPENETVKLYLPDNQYAWIEVPETNKFVFSARVLWGVTINRLDAAGLGYHAAESGLPASDVTAWFEGDGQDATVKFKDTYCVGANTEKIYDALDGNDNGVGPSDWKLNEAWMTIDYNVSQAGKVVLTVDAIDYTNANDPTDPKTMTYGYDIGVSSVTGDYHAIDAIRLGGAYSWSQGYYDDVTFTAVPEPGSMIALGTGLVGLVGFGIRRRK